ncbi:hypothetical protein EWM64_g64 [Hericium alpestre]|uniref:60S ribosomal protein L36 n=1 Tax=Hericium alpestre TaxID=135208 RepID=A0A4Z0AA54_9AGAM|nr:hypothetical protein EWM64_g64 [Hericium alpestre]
MSRRSQPTVMDASQVEVPEDDALSGAAEGDEAMQEVEEQEGYSHDYFCEVAEDFIEDDFNLTGLNAMVPFWKEAMEMVLDVEPDEDSAKIPDVSIVEASAELLYGLVHQRYILTRAGLQAMSYREFMPAPFWKPPSSEPLSPVRSPGSITGSTSSSGAPFVNPNVHGGQKRAAGKVYTAKIYGFRVSEKAKNGPRMQWMRLRPESPEELDYVDWRGRWIEEEDDYEEDADAESTDDRHMEDFDADNAGGDDDEEEEEEEEEEEQIVGGSRNRRQATESPPTDAPPVSPSEPTGTLDSKAQPTTVKLSSIPLFNTGSKVKYGYRQTNPPPPPSVKPSRTKAMVRNDLRRGLNHGHPTTPIPKAVRPSHRKGIRSTKTTFVRSVVREVVGFSPYERRVMELLRNSKDKKARKLTKKRLGTLLRSKRKLEELSGIIQESRRAGGH